MKKLVLAGGTGFIGTYLARHFRLLGFEVIIISRGAGDLTWSDHAGLVGALENADALINLAGKSVDCRYNEHNRKEILLSRTETTRILGEAIGACQHPPRLWINSSTATIYRHAEDRPMTEASGEMGTGFSVEVAKAWEAAFFSFQLPDTRQVALRIAIVLGNGGVMKPFLHLVRYGLGGPQGHGRQMFSWIHIEDLFRCIRFVMDHEDLSGVYNCAAPGPVTNTDLMHTIREITGTRFFLPAPAWLLGIGAWLIRTETELILKSRWVIPEKLLRAGFVFAYPSLDGAIRQIVPKKP